MDRRLVALVVAIALAGCTSTKEGGSTTSISPTSGAPAVAAQASDAGAAPAWAVGDWWTYQVDYSSARESNTFTIVVYKEDADHWYLSGVEKEGDQLAEFSHYPTLGPWTKTAFEPTIHGFKIPFFRFPLTDGKTWTDKYRDQDASWKATAKGSTFEVTMTQGSAPPVLTFGYDRAVGFFTHLEFTFGNTAMKLVASGRGYDKPVTVLTFTEHVHGPFPVARANPGATAPDQFPAFVNFEVAGDKALLFAFYYGGAAGTYEFVLGPSSSPHTEGIEEHPQTTDQSAAMLWGEFTQPTAGQWGLIAGGATQENGGFVFAEVLEVAETTITPARPA